MKETITLKSEEDARSLLGVLDKNVKTLEDMFGVEIFARGRQIKVKGDKRSIASTKHMIRDLLQEKQKGKDITELIQKKSVPQSPPTVKSNKIFSGLFFRHCSREVSPKTKGQAQYVKAIFENDVLFSIGPAGTGKTYLAMACAIESFKRREVEKIILSRPAVETGERLGFLPGDLHQKINPYLRPLLDALYELMHPEEIAENMEKGKIEIIPLAYMRGRTLNDSFVILDEAQNTTHLQMKMFLTRLGNGSKMVITGDVTQIDFPSSKQSGLVMVEKILKKVPKIKFIYLKEQDIVRNPIVKSILRAYEKVKK